MWVLAGWYSITQPNLPSDIVKRIVPSSDYVLVGTGFGFAVYNVSTGKWEKNSSNFEVKDILLVGNTLWLATLSGIYKSDISTLSVTLVNPIPASSVEVVSEYVVVGTYGAGLYIYDEAGNFNKSLSDSSINDVVDLELVGDSLAVANTSGEVVLLPADLSTPYGSTIFSGHGAVRRMKYFDGKLWIATQQGLFCEGKVQSGTSGKDVMGFVSFENELWIAVYGEGVYQGGQLHSLSTSEIFDIAVVGSEVWVATSQGIMVYQKEEALLSDVRVFPNPGNPPFTISYRLSQTCSVSIRVYDVFGTLLREILNNASKAEGLHSEDIWDGLDFTGRRTGYGIYIIRITAENENGRVTKDFKLVIIQ